MNENQLQRTFACSFASLIGLVIAVVLFQPGFVSPDSLAALSEGRFNCYSDWHPPLMSLAWRYMDMVIAGPLGMLIFFNLTFWAGLGLLAFFFIPNVFCCVLFIWGVGFFPPVFFLLGHIWKDVGMSVSLLFSCALIVWGSRTGSRIPLILSTPFTFFAYSLRHNAAPAILPLAFWICYESMHPNRRKFIKVAVFGVAYFLILTLLVLASNRLLVSPEKRMHPEQAIWTFDLAGTSFYSGKNYFPDWAQKHHPPADMKRIIEVYNPGDINPILWGTVNITSDEDELSNLRKAWLVAIRSDFGSYLKHRLATFSAFLSFGNGPVEATYWNYMPDQKAGPVQFNWLQQKLYRPAWLIMSDLVKTRLFSPGYYLLSILGMLAFVWARTADLKPFQIAIGASGIFYSLFYIFIGAGSYYRYGWWTVLVAMIMPILCLGKLEKYERRVKPLI